MSILLILLGVLMIVIGIWAQARVSSEGAKDARASRGIILIGPIPVVWGFGPKGKMIAVALFLVVVVLWLVILL